MASTTAMAATKPLRFGVQATDRRDRDRDDDPVSVSVRVDRLMESHSVDALQETLHALHRDIDAKRQELRTMVGERYRDLMEAANTVSSMSDGATAFKEDVEEAKRRGAEVAAAAATAAGADDFASSRPRPPPDALLPADDPNRPYLAVAAEIKLLMAAPEMMWAAVDGGDLLRASELFLFARHVHTGLCMEDGRASSAVSGTQIAAWFPVIGRQWASIAHFHDAIIDACRRTLADAESKREDWEGRQVKALASIVLLEGRNLEEVFQELMEIRKATLEKQLREDSQKSTAKEMILNSVRIILASIRAVYDAFVRDGIAQLLAPAAGPRPTTFSSLFHTKQSPVDKYLPPTVRDFSPSVVKPLGDLGEDFLGKAVTSWLDGAHSLVTERTADVLAHVKSIASLAAMKATLRSAIASDEEDSDGVMKAVTGNDLNLWDEFYRNVFRDRIESLVSSHVIGISYCVQSSIEAARDDLDHVSDLESLLGSNAEGLKANGESVRLLARGYSSRVQMVCQQLDTAMKNLLDDVSALVGESPATLLKDRQWQETQDADNGNVLSFVQQKVEETVAEMLGEIRLKYIDGGTTSRGLLLFLGRFCQAAPELCPHLERAVLAADASSRTDSRWSNLVAKLESESEAAFLKGIRGVADDFGADLGKRLSGGDRLECLPSCEAVAIREQDEQAGVEVESTLLVPQHLSVSLASALHEYSRQVYAVAPHSLPRQIQSEVGAAAAEKVCEAYAAAAAAAAALSSGSNAQPVLLQLLFDLQFVGQCLVARDRAGTLGARCDAVRSSLEALVDPFDLSVFAPHLETRVKRAVLREHALLGVLVPQDRFNLMASLKSSLPPPATTTTPASSTQEHNAMWTLGQRLDKIPLVPVARSSAAGAGAGLGGRGSQQQRHRLTAASISREGAVSPVTGRRRLAGDRSVSPSPSAAKLAASAGSFFEAMSTSWFGGK